MTWIFDISGRNKGGGRGRKEGRKEKKGKKNGASVFSILVTGFNPISFQFDSLSSLRNFILNFKQDRGRVSRFHCRCLSRFTSRV